jgi:hypothetical protein
MKVMTFVKLKKQTPLYPKDSEAEAVVTVAVRKMHYRHNRTQVGRESMAQNPYL